MAHAFFLGVDLAENDDDSVGATLTILEKEKDPSAAEAHFRLDHARQYTKDSVDVLADHLQSLLAERPYIGRTNIVVNRTGATGKALVEALAERGLDPVAATLTGGDGVVSGEPDEVGVHLGRVEALRTLAELKRDGRLRIEDHATEVASQLARGVQHVAEALDEADGNWETPEAEGSRLNQLGEVDAAVTSAALAAWCGTERSFDPSQHLKEDPQTQTGNGTTGR